MVLLIDFTLAEIKTPGAIERISEIQFCSAEYDGQSSS